jgi:hypothetical protein
MALTHVLQPITINKLEVKNRILRTGHGTYYGKGSVSDDLRSALRCTKSPWARNRGGGPRRLTAGRRPVMTAVPQLREQLHAVFVHRRGYPAKAGNDLVVPPEQRIVDAGAVHAGDSRDLVR